MTFSTLNPSRASVWPSLTRELQSVLLDDTLLSLASRPAKSISDQSSLTTALAPKGRAGLADRLFDIFEQDLDVLFSPRGGTGLGVELFAAGEMVDHYCILQLVGQGGMADVYLAYDTTLDCCVALKVLRADCLHRPVAAQSFQIEARTLAILNHPNIVDVQGVGEARGRPYLALEYLEGQTLREKMRDQGLSTDEIMQLSLTLARVLSHIHSKSFVHCDLKPENIIIGNDGQLKLLDFGLAIERSRVSEQLNDALLTWSPPAASADRAGTAPSAAMDGGMGTGCRAMVLCGTPLYMAPEQWQGESAGSAVDVWALGVVLHELLTSAPPVREQCLFAQAATVCSSDPMPQLPSRSDVPPGLATLIARCLQKDPRSRISAGDAAAWLELVSFGWCGAPAGGAN